MAQSLSSNDDLFFFFFRWNSIAWILKCLLIHRKYHENTFAQEKNFSFCFILNGLLFELIYLQSIKQKLLHKLNHGNLVTYSSYLSQFRYAKFGFGCKYFPFHIHTYTLYSAANILSNKWVIFHHCSFQLIFIINFYFLYVQFYDDCKSFVAKQYRCSAIQWVS